MAPLRITPKAPSVGFLYIHDPSGVSDYSERLRKWGG